MTLKKRRNLKTRLTALMVTHSETDIWMSRTERIQLLETLQSYSGNDFDMRFLSHVKRKEETKQKKKNKKKKRTKKRKEKTKQNKKKQKNTKMQK